MKSLYALGRLLARPLWLVGAAYLAFLVASAPWFSVDDITTALVSIRAGAPSPGALDALWRDTLLIPLAFGAGAAMVTMDLLSKPFARMLPAVQTLMLRGMIMLGVVVSLGVAVVHARAEGNAIAMTAFGVALVAYCAWIIPLDLAVPRSFRFVLWPAGILLIIDPALLIGPTTAHPGPMALVALLCTGIVLVRGLTPVPSVRRTSAGRDWADLSREQQEGHWVIRFFNPPADLDRPWCRVLAADRLGDWMHAVLYESTAQRRWGWLVPGIVRSAVLAALVSVGLPTGAQFVVFLILQTLALGPTPLSGGFPYPISRARRAQAEFWSSFARSSFYCALMAVLLPAVYWAFAPVRARIGFSPDQHATLATMLLSIGVALAVAPMVQWAWIQGVTALPGQLAPARAHRAHGIALYAGWGVLMLLIGGGLTLAKVATHLGTARGTLVVATLFVAVQAGYWVALRRDAARSDLA